MNYIVFWLLGLIASISKSDWATEGQNELYINNAKIVLTTFVRYFSPVQHFRNLVQYIIFGSPLFIPSTCLPSVTKCLSWKEWQACRARDVLLVKASLLTKKDFPLEVLAKAKWQILLRHHNIKLHVAFYAWTVRNNGGFVVIFSFTQVRLASWMSSFYLPFTFKPNVSFIQDTLRLPCLEWKFVDVVKKYIVIVLIFILSTKFISHGVSRSWWRLW